MTAPSPLRRLVLAAALLSLAVLPGFGAGLDDTSLSPMGTLQRVTSEQNPNGGTRIVHTVQYPDGSSTTRSIPITDDFIADTAPVISTEPGDTGRSVAAWIRRDTEDEVVFSIFDGRNWSPIKAVPEAPGTADADARVIWGKSGILHMMWRVDSAAGSQYWWAQYDSSGRPLSDPMAVSDTPGETVGENGGPTNPESRIASSDVLFSFVRPASAGGGMVLFGGRDEPNPIGCGIYFQLPRTAMGAAPDNTRGFIVDGRVAFTFRLNAKLYYTIRDPAHAYWLPYRMINLSCDVPESRARILVREMLDRIPAPATP